MYKYWYDYAKPKSGAKAKLWFTDRDSLILYVKSEDVYEHLARDIEQRFDTSNYEDERTSIVIKREVIELMKDQLGEIKTKESVALRPRMYSYLMMMVMLIRGQEAQINM